MRKYKPKKQRKNLEERVVRDVANYLVLNYRGVRFRFDVTADLPMAAYKAQRIIAKYKHQSKYPDLFIARPSIIGGVLYCGLYLELKALKSKVYKLNGELKKDGHLEGQDETLAQLRSDGYYAVFAYPDDNMVYDLIDEYLKGFDLFKKVMLNCKKQ